MALELIDGCCHVPKIMVAFVYLIKVHIPLSFESLILSTSTVSTSSETVHSCRIRSVLAGTAGKKNLPGNF